MGHFLHRIYQWYRTNKRNLPWRQTSNPYNIWVSEIILQQTQVKQGTGYYNRFISRFPDITTLAAASEDEVLKMWQGLGYYSRARNLHFSSKVIMQKHNAIFPDNYKDIISLKGIGDYTAAAIISIAFNQPYAAVDGNINRFLSRYFEIEEPVNSKSGKNKIKTIADEILNIGDPGMHNQALMEIGAVICLPVNPFCSKCPVNETCLALANHSVSRLPVKKPAIKQKKRFFNYFLIEEKESILFQQRKAEDIWKNLYELPLIETEIDKNIFDILNSTEFKNMDFGSESEIINITEPIIHILSHQKISARFIHIRFLSENKLTSNVLRVNKKDIPKFAVPRLIENYLIKSGFLL